MQKTSQLVGNLYLTSFFSSKKMKLISFQLRSAPIKSSTSKLFFRVKRKHFFSINFFPDLFNRPLNVAGSNTGCWHEISKRNLRNSVSHSSSVSLTGNCHE